MKRTKVRLGDVRANPFRNIERYPINRERVDELKESIEATDFWENLIGRTTEDGGVEIAFGHHRMVALREVYDDDHVIEVATKDLSDALMIQMMARENMEATGGEFIVTVENVRAVVSAYAEDKIELSPVESGKGVRQAPSYQTLDAVPADHAYNQKTVGEFLGQFSGTRVTRSVQAAFAALVAMEDGLIDESDLYGLSVREAQEVVKTLRSSEKRREMQAENAATEAEAKEIRAEGKRAAKKVGKTLAKKLRNDEIGRKQAATEGRKIDPPKRKEDKVLLAHELLRGLVFEVAQSLDGGDPTMAEKLAELQGMLPLFEGETRQLEQLVANLRRVAAAFTAAADAIEGRVPEGKRLSA